MATRPVITVFDAIKGYVKESLPLSAVLTAPIRLEILRFAHDNLAKNKRQPYAISEWTDHRHSAGWKYYIPTPNLFR